VGAALVGGGVAAFPVQASPGVAGKVMPGCELPGFSSLKGAEVTNKPKVLVAPAGAKVTFTSCGGGPTTLRQL